MAKYREKVKVVALSQDVRESRLSTLGHMGAGFSRPTMWAHYAGNHTGCCIAFDKARLTQRIMHESSDLFGDPAGVAQGAVSYSADAFGGDASLRGINADEVRQNGPEIAVRDHFRRIGIDVWFQKHSDWSPEAEYRFVYRDPVSQNDMIFVDLTDCVVGLILGVDFRESHLGIARDFCDAFALGGCIAKSIWIGCIGNHRTFARKREDGGSPFPDVESPM